MRTWKWSPPLKLALVYFCVSALWILFSDRIVASLVTNLSLLTTLQIVKGWAFVAISAALLYLLMRYLMNRAMEQLEAKNAELAEWSHKLEARVAERTADLNAANIRLKELDTLKSKLISEISHELRTPITSMGLKIELMERVDPTRREPYINGLKEQIDLLKELLNDVMDISWLESGAEAPELAPVDINQLVQDVVDEHRPIAEATGLRLDYETDPSSPSVMGRYNPLSRMLTNLVTNAIKYTAAGWIKVSVRSDPAANEAIIQVQDSGMGIPPEDMDYLFDRFYRGQAVRALEIPGSGLGLSIVKDILEAHRGSIDIQSQFNQGSTFTVRLPLH
jgi:signal transduction histidine kinase